MSGFFLITIAIILAGLYIIYIKSSKPQTKQTATAIEHIEKYSDIKMFLIKYRCQVKCFAECLDYYHVTGEWSVAFFDLSLRYYQDGEFLSLMFEGEMYAIGKIPQGFPVEELHEESKASLTDHVRGAKHGDR